MKDLRKSTMACALLTALLLMRVGLGQNTGKKPATMKSRGAAPTPAAVAGYTPVVVPANIAPTAATTDPNRKVDVVGQPRTTVGHPCTIWDEQDIAHYKEMLKTSKPLQDDLAKLREEMDHRIAAPLGVPEPKKGADGKWMFLGDVEPYKSEGGERAYWAANEKLAKDMANLATLYALTGNAKYGEFCKRILLAYAKGYPNFGYPPGAPNYRSARDRRLSGQFLVDGGWLIMAGFAYDMVYNVPSWTPQERALIHDNLFKPIVDEFRFVHIADDSYLNDPTNRSACYDAATLIAGYGTEDQAMIQDALYGTGGTKEQPRGGVYGTFFAPVCISPDGLWAESIGYQLSIAGASLIDQAEVLWHHGIDMYRYHNSVLKRIFDSPFEIAYPDAVMSLPQVGDTTHRMAISQHPDPVSYEYAYRRYNDPRYLNVISQIRKTLSMSPHQAPPSLLYDVDAGNAATDLKQQAQSINFFDNGIGVQRLQAKDGIVQLIFQSGPSHSHGHPDKLSLDLFALGDVVAPMGGVIFPYGDPLDETWYHTTVANCALAVDERSQVCYESLSKSNGVPVVVAPQLVFAPASTMCLQRACTNTHAAGVALDRSLFLTPDYVVDLFAAFSTTAHTYDLAWHLRGQLASDLPLQPMKFPEPVANGYNALSDIRHAGTNNAWSVVLTHAGKTVRLLAAGGIDTDVITAKGHYRAGLGRVSADEMPPTILQRRTKESATVYGNALDISDTKDGYVKTVTQHGGLTAGYGLLKVDTVKGTDLCFTAYRPATYKADALETDAQQAMAMMDGQNIRALYLGGGKTLKVAGATIQRSEPGLAYVEKLANGTYVVGNPSPSDATVTVTLPGVPEAGPFTAQLKAGSTVELAAKKP